MALQIRQAKRTQSKVRIALVGPAGSGKTCSGLKILRGLVGTDGRILVIDTERGSASLYADEPDIAGTFDVMELPSFSPDTYVEALQIAAKENYDGVLVDSLSHAWTGKDGALELVDRARARQKSDNSFIAWRDVTPMHNTMVDALVSTPYHIIVTMRTKTEYVLEENERGKKVPRKVGMQPVQRDGLEYEFDVVGDMDQDHRLVISKTRCRPLTDGVYVKPGEDVAKIIRDWLASGSADAPEARTVSAPEPQQPDTEQMAKDARQRARNEISKAMADTGATKQQVAALSDGKASKDMTVEELEAVARRIRTLYGGPPGDTQPENAVVDYAAEVERMRADLDLGKMDIWEPWAQSRLDDLTADVASLNSEQYERLYFAMRNELAAKAHA